MAEEKSRLRAWMMGGEELDTAHGAGPETHPWYRVIWLTGVDYFSTLGYQPGIALLAAGVLSPVATAMLVAVTLACALPIYRQVAHRSYVGQGSIAMLENLLPGWWGRILVLVLLGFAATDFVITMTLSAADAATHAAENPYLHGFLGSAKLPMTLLLLLLLAAVFINGFKEAIRLATLVCIPYLLLNVAVLVRTLYEVAVHPVVIPQWRAALWAQGDWRHLVLAGAVLFPRLALGLSGFETGVSVMPLIGGDASDAKGERPQGRIRNTGKLLMTAALIMSVLLMTSSFVTTLLIPPAVYQEGGPASGRAIAYLAHQYMGNIFGSIYDLSTILILWFAGASAMAGLLHLIPRYMPRVGLAPQWVAYARPLVVVLFGFNVLITVIFKANVEKQGGAYATGVLVLMSSAAVASMISLWKEKARWLSLYCALVVLVFGYTTGANVVERPDGIIIASCFILFILALSAVSRYLRATELRIGGHRFVDPESERMWNALAPLRVNMVPIMGLDAEARARRSAVMQEHYRVDGPVAFVHVNLLDNRSEFLSPIEISVRMEDGQYLIEASQAVAVANAVAYLSELLHPKSIFIGLSGRNLMQQSFRYFLLGEGEHGLMVYTILQRYWETTREEEERPCIFLMSA